jgi:hypothetical protein
LNNRKRILFVTPHQLSTEAKQLIRNGVSDLNFVKEIAEKGYTELSRQIDQVVDLEIYIHIAYVNRKPVLTVQRGKHRGCSIIDEKYKYFTLNFPYRAPIKETLHEAVNNAEYTGDAKLPEATGTDTDFDF